jgi:hypothetical protein
VVRLELWDDNCRLWIWQTLQAHEEDCGGSIARFRRVEAAEWTRREGILLQRWHGSVEQCNRKFRNAPAELRVEHHHVRAWYAKPSMPVHQPTTTHLHLGDLNQHNRSSRKRASCQNLGFLVKPQTLTSDFHYSDRCPTDSTQTIPYLGCPFALREWS